MPNTTPPGAAYGLPTPADGRGGADPAADPAAARWRAAEAVLDAALDLPAAERAAYVARACGADAALRAEVERVLAACDAPGAAALLPETPAAAAAAGLVARALTHPGEAGDALGTSRPLGAAPARVGPWRVLAPLGEGGMGAVYAAERADGAFERRVAVKLLRRGLDGDAHFVARFEAERRILARLEHPAVVRLLDGGVTEAGVPYLVMERVDGRPVDAYCAEDAPSVEARLALAARVCDAVAHAHAAGVVHRDLKPSNVLVTAEGQPKLLDFGIAKLVARDVAPDGAEAAERARTRTGQRLLTPEYASPEQVRGGPATPATDVYALGVLLYELLAGRRPHAAAAGRGVHALERAVVDEDPPPPSRAVDPARPDAAARRRRLRGDLDAVVCRALHREPARRYPDAAALAEDLRRHLAGWPVRARGRGAGYRARRWARRHRAVVAAAAAGLALGTGGLLAVLRSAPAAQRAALPARAGAAARYYEDGLRAFAAGTFADATRAFGLALAEDSAFAMAAYYGAEAAARDEDYERSRALLLHAVRHAPRAPERERLVILADYARRLRLPSLGAYADSLVARHSGAPEGPLYAGLARLRAADYPGAVARFARVVAMDSAALAGGRLPCHACEALAQTVQAHLAADSLGAAERAAERAVAAQPRSAAAWRALALVRLYRSAPGEAADRRYQEAYRRAVELDPSGADWAAEWAADRHIRAGDFAAADALLRGRMQTAPAGREERSLGLLVTSLRNQRRWGEALALARRFRAVAPAGGPREGAPADAAPLSAALEAQVLLESGRPRAAAALYDSIARWRTGMPGDGVRYRVAHLAHRADALAAAGDTAALAAVADTLRALAPRTGAALDARVHHHARGLLLLARGHPADAAAELRRAVASPTLGYTRTNLALARALVALGRPREAVAALQPALRGSLELNNGYATHAEVHAALAAAWAAAGGADSAAVHRRWGRSEGR